MGIHIEPHIRNYWNTKTKTGQSSPLHDDIRDTMGQKRWKQIHQYFHVWDPTLDHSTSDRTARPHEKVDPLVKLLLAAFQRY